MWQVYFKELLELTRDKKTLIFTILLPTLVMPIILFGFISLSTQIAKKAIDENLTYTVVGSEYYRDLVEALAENDKFKYVPPPSPKANNDIWAEVNEMINTNEIRFAIVIPHDISSLFKEGLSTKIEMLYNASAPTSEIIFNRVNRALQQLKDKERNKRLTFLGLTKAQGNAINNPIIIVKKSTADERESLGETVGGVLPYLLIIIALSGAMYPAIDIGVGEKERGTLETLLLTPVSRFRLVFAKFSVIFTTSFISVFLSLISFALMVMVLAPAVVSGLGVEASGKVRELFAALSTIGIGDVLLMFLMLVPVAAIFASLLLSVSIYARTYKEAQNYMSPIMMIVIFPLVLPLLPGVKLDWVWASVPITNVSLAIKEIFKGTIDVDMLFIIFGSTTFIAGAFLALCNWWFQREQVLFRN